jgi:hypothetical protein
VLHNRLTILCNGARQPRRAPERTLALEIAGPCQNVHLKLAAMSRGMARRVRGALCDLLELAAYIFSA